MKGMILAAGLGTRLRPLSYELPKPVIPVLGRPLCTYNMEFLRQGGVRSFVMNLHTRPKLVQQHVAGWAGKGIRVEFTLEPVILGTGGGIWNAREFLKTGTFVSMNGDTILSFPLDAALAFHRERNALATLILFPDPAKRYTPVWLGKRDRITGFGSEAGGGERSGFYTGCQIIEPELLHEIPPARTSCIIRETYTPLITGGAPVFGFLSSGNFLEFGTPADYLRGTLSLLPAERAEAMSSSSEEGGVAIIPPVYISPKANVAPGTRIGPAAVVEGGATVSEGASATRSILWPGSVLAAGEELDGTILTPRRRVRIS